MNALYLIATLGLVAITYGIPMPQAATAPNLVPGVFIPADAFKNLQDRANANQPLTNQYQPSTNVQPAQPITNQVYQPTNIPSQPATYQPANTNVQYQPSTQPAVNQPAITVQPQPSGTVVNNQAQPLVAARVSDQATNQPAVVLANQPRAQPSQSVIYVQQPQSSQPTILVQQQPQQPNQGYVIQNAKPTNLVFANPSNNNQNTNSNTVYTLIPLNSQNSNSNSNTGSYLIPVQAGNSNPIVLSTGN